MNTVVQQTRMSGSEQPHFPRLITEKRFTGVRRAGDSKNADNPSGTNRTGFFDRCKNIFRCVRECNIPC